MGSEDVRVRSSGLPHCLCSYFSQPVVFSAPRSTGPTRMRSPAAMRLTSTTCLCEGASVPLLIRRSCSSHVPLASYQLFRNHPRVIAKIKSVLIDEVSAVNRRLCALQLTMLLSQFQDTNSVQYDIVKLIAAPSGSLTVVGDPDQSSALLSGLVARARRTDGRNCSQSTDGAMPRSRTSRKCSRVRSAFPRGRRSEVARCGDQPNAPLSESHQLS